MYVVQIVEHETEKGIKRFKPTQSERAAERLERGVNINLDHRHYYTEVVEEGANADPSMQHSTE